MPEAFCSTIDYHSKLNKNMLSVSGIKTLNPIICCEGMEAATKTSMPKLIDCICNGKPKMKFSSKKHLEKRRV